jgi:hypothetical protein
LTKYIRRKRQEISAGINKEGNMTVNNIKGTNHEISIIVGAFSVCIFLFSGFAAWKNKKTINRRRPAQIKTPS